MKDSYKISIIMFNYLTDFTIEVAPLNKSYTSFIDFGFEKIKEGIFPPVFSILLDTYLYKLIEEKKGDIELLLLIKTFLISIHLGEYRDICDLYYYYLPRYNNIDLIYEIEKKYKKFM